MAVTGLVRLIKKIIRSTIDWILYSVLNESHRKKLGNLLSEDQKEMIRNLINGKMQAQRRQLKQIKYHLYNLGFTDRALQELKEFYVDIDNPDIKRMAAWELCLWYANQYTKEGAKKALEYLEEAKRGEKYADQLRRISIIEAECYDQLEDKEKGKQIIHSMLTKQHHHDLYLAAANLEESMQERLTWINKTMEMYQLQPIYFESTQEVPSYDDLRTVAPQKTITDGPKVSVIIPAFRAEDGIGVAIESILEQTWQNLELIVVDDCSPDNTAKVIQAYVEKDSRVKLLSTPQNSGPYVARNIGLKAATGEFVTINDADDWSHAEKIEIQAQHLMDHPSIIANTSEHARLTDEELKLYRRGTPGRYIFPNMSSLMFRREMVIEKMGFWDSVRFAADGEFKRRFLKVFGQASYKDLPSGPLSLPRQSVQSLTSSSAFGYNGFFMGVRKEFVESLEFYHKRADNLYYPFPMKERPYPVPEPMWPNREEKSLGKRQFDTVIASDFRLNDNELPIVLNEIKKQLMLHDKVGLVQLNHYDLAQKQKVNEKIRYLLDGNHLQMIVYGEKINANTMIVINPVILEDKQRYVPELQADEISVVVNQVPQNIKPCLVNMEAYFGDVGIWYSVDHEIRSLLINHREIIPLSNENWENQVEYGKQQG